MATTDKKNFRASSSVYVCDICIYLYVYVLYCFSSRGNYSLGRLFEIQLPASILILMRRGIFVSHLFRLLVHSFLFLFAFSSLSFPHTFVYLCCVFFSRCYLGFHLYFFFCFLVVVFPCFFLPPHSRIHNYAHWRRLCLCLHLHPHLYLSVASCRCYQMCLGLEAVTFEVCSSTCQIR